MPKRDHHPWLSLAGELITVSSINVGWEREDVFHVGDLIRSDVASISAAAAASVYFGAA